MAKKTFDGNAFATGFVADIRAKNMLPKAIALTVMENGAFGTTNGRSVSPNVPKPLRAMLEALKPVELAALKANFAPAEKKVDPVEAMKARAAKMTAEAEAAVQKAGVNIQKWDPATVPSGKKNGDSEKLLALAAELKLGKAASKMDNKTLRAAIVAAMVKANTPAEVTPPKEKAVKTPKAPKVDADAGMKALLLSSDWQQRIHNEYGFPLVHALAYPVEFAETVREGANDGECKAVVYGLLTNDPKVACVVRKVFGKPNRVEIVKDIKGKNMDDTRTKVWAAMGKAAGWTR